MNAGAALELRGVAQRFGRRWALRGITLEAAGGEILALTGRNGSGKTTLLRICATLLRPTRGSGRIFGHDLVRDAGRVRERVGYLAHDAGLYANLTAEENLVFAERMRGGPTERGRILRVLEDTGLAGERNERVRGFSAGMRRRLALARLLLRPPDLLLMDEPYASFDEDGIARVNAFAAAVAGRGGLAMIATHDLARARGLPFRHIHLEEGQIVDGPEAREAALVPAANGP